MLKSNIIRIVFVVLFLSVIAFAIYLFRNTTTSVTINTGTTPTYLNNNSEKINLSNKGITSLPSEIGKLTNTTSLDVSHNNLTGALPAEIRQLTKLVTLNASYNKLTGIPAEIGQLSNLKYLDLSNNEITDFPNEIYNIKQLVEFNISNNKFTQEKIDTLQLNLPNTKIINN
jgi:Leucine-rich repeat (LRR) protein